MSFARPDPVAQPEPSTAAELTTAPKRVGYWCERVLFPDAAEPTPGWIEVEGERIVTVGTGISPEPAQVLDGLLEPGFVDVHCHGGGGASFVTADAEVAREALRAHRQGPALASECSQYLSPVSDPGTRTAPDAAFVLVSSDGAPDRWRPRCHSC